MLHFASLFLAAGLDCTDPVPTSGSTFPITALPDLWIPFSDGTTTRADVRFPSVAPGPCGWPIVVLVHGMGGTRSVVASLAESLAEHGYLTVAYDVRGHGFHGGENTHTSLRERIDLGEVIQWTGASLVHLADPTRVGVDGASMGGMHAWMAAAWDGAPYEPNPWNSGSFPDIDAVVCENTTPDFGANYAPQGLAVHCSDYSFLSSSGVRFDPVLRAAALDAFTTQDYAAWRALVAGPLSDPSPRIPSISTPVMAMMAWDDFLFPSEALTRAWDRMPESTPKKLYMGTGGHNSPNNANESAFRAGWRLDWFDRWLKGTQNGIDQGEEITYAVTPDDNAEYLSPTSTWDHKVVSHWPPSDTVAARWYLRETGRLAPAPPTTLEPKEALSQFVAPGFGMAQQAATNFQLAQVEANIPRASLAYESEPLSTHFEYAGEARVHLVLASAQTRWQVRARLIDVHPSGARRYVAGGSFFAFDDQPAGTRTVDIAIGANAVLFRAGHRVRLELQNLQIHDPPQGAGLRFAAYPSPFSVEVRHTPLELSWIDVPTLARPDPVVFGNAKVNSLGCLPAITWRGTPGMGTGAPFRVSATNVLNHKTGMLLYSTGYHVAPFHGGSLYVGSPVRRTPQQNSGGNLGASDCSGEYVVAFNDLIQSGVDPILQPGATIYAQFYTRDPSSLGGVGLTDAVTFGIGP